MGIETVWHPSDGLLWGTATSPRLAGKPGPKPVPGKISIITRVGKSRPSIVLRFRWPWWQETAGWRPGDKLVFGNMVDFDDSKNLWYCAGWIGKAATGERGHALHLRGRSRDALLILPLDSELPYLPCATPCSEPSLFDDDPPTWHFTIAESPEPFVTVGEAAP